jgi:hypothetical protein
VNAWIGSQERLLIDVLQDRAVAWREPRQGVAQQVLLPVANRPDAIYEHESPNCSAIALRREHRQSASPGVPEDVPLREADRVAERREVTGVVLDARRPRTGRRLRRTSTSLVVQDQLPALG